MSSDNPERRPIYPLTVTFTGADETTTREKLARIAWHAAEVNIEIGVLVCAAARDDATIGHRYPSIETAHRIVEQASDLGLSTAIHLCGAEAIAAVTCGRLELDVQALIQCADRCQLNLGEAERLAGCLSSARARFHGPRTTPRIIVQVRSQPWPEPLTGFDYLYDASAGCGVSPDAWPEIPPKIDGAGYGLAGGLRPGDGSIARALSALLPHLREGRSGLWIDMETGVRSAEVFDPEKCRDVLSEVQFALRQGQPPARVSVELPHKPERLISCRAPSCCRL